MFIKLHELYTGEDLYVNANAISSVFYSDRKGRDHEEDATRVYITGETEPWFVCESVSEVMEKIHTVLLRGESEAMER